MPIEARPFIGREAELRQLEELMRTGADSRGGLLFLEGDPGMGKTRLLLALQDRAKETPEFKEARFVKTTCPAFLGTQNPYEPLVEILQELTANDDQRRDVAKLVVTILKETGSDWLNVIPGVGPAVGAAIKTATVIGKHLLDLNDEERAASSKVLAAQYTSLITSVAAHYRPLVLIIEDAHWIDSASCEPLLRLAQKAAELPLVILVTYAPSFMSAEHPLSQVKVTLARSLLSRTIQLSGWEREGIESFLRSRYGQNLHPELATWLMQLTKGSPEFVSETLALLEQQEVIIQAGGGYALAGDLVESVDGWELQGPQPHFKLPENFRAVLEHRISRLSQDDREMLALAAVQGQRFRSSILVELLEQKEIEVWDRLGSIEEQHRIISFYTGDAASQADFDVYAFEHGGMHKQFYDSVREPVRARYHERIGTLLERSLLAEPKPARRLVLGAAFHFERGRKPLSAGLYYHKAAESAYGDGAFAQSIDLSRRALQQARLLPQNVPENDRLLAEILLLLLLASELHWHGKAEGEGGDALSLSSLVEEAQAAAKRAGDPALVGQAMFLRGQSLVATGNLASAQAAMQEALEMARQAGDPVLQFAMMPHLGNIMNSQNLGAGMELQYQALQLYEKELLTGADATQPAVQRHFYRLQGFIGVGEFDRGNFGAALERLSESITGLKSIGARQDLPRMLNYLAQVYTAIGLFADAEGLLQESLEHFDEDVKSPWRACNLAFLGKVCLESERVGEAGEFLRKGWQETQATWNVDLAQLVRTYYAELLLDKRFEGYNPVEAEGLLRATEEESKASAVHHTRISALALLASAALEGGDPGKAVELSTEAVNELLLRHPLPALRAEEIHLNQYRVMQKAGRPAEAALALERAYTILQEKAASLRSDAHRHSFLTAVPTSRAILSAWGAR